MYYKECEMAAVGGSTAQKIVVIVWWMLPAKVSIKYILLLYAF
jgi:hypothetical protein